MFDDHARVTRAQAVFVDRTQLTYFDEVRGTHARIALEARTELELIVVLGCVDLVAARVVRRAWAWRGLMVLEAPAPAS